MRFIAKGGQPLRSLLDADQVDYLFDYRCPSSSRVNALPGRVWMNIAFWNRKKLGEQLIHGFYEHNLPSLGQRS